MRITPLDIRKQEFRKTMRGLDTDEVYAFLGTVADEYEAVLSDNKRMREHIVQLEERLSEFKNMETNLRNTLLTAEKVTEEAKSNARKEADLIVRSAEVDAEKAAESIRAQTQQLRREILELKKHKDNYIARLRTLLESHMGVIDGFEEDYAEVDREIEAIGKKIEEDTRSAVSSPRMSREKITEDLPKGPAEDKVTWGDEEPGEEAERPTFPRPGQWEQKESPGGEKDSSGGPASDSVTEEEKTTAGIPGLDLDKEAESTGDPAGSPGGIEVGRGGADPGSSRDDHGPAKPAGEADPGARGQQSPPSHESANAPGGSAGRAGAEAGATSGEPGQPRQHDHQASQAGGGAPPVYASAGAGRPASTRGPGGQYPEGSQQAATGTAVETEQPPAPGTIGEETGREAAAGAQNHGSPAGQAGNERPDDWRAYEVRDTKPDWSGYEIPGSERRAEGGPAAGAPEKSAGSPAQEPPAVEQPTDNEVEQALSGLTDSPDRARSRPEQEMGTAPHDKPQAEDRGDRDAPKAEGPVGPDARQAEKPSAERDHSGTGEPAAGDAGQESGPSEGQTWSMEELRRNLTNIDRDDE